MTDREIMQQALYALEIESKGYADKVVRNRGIITALRERLEQPVQEPVAHTLNCVCGAVWDISPDGAGEMVHTPDAAPQPTTPHGWKLVPVEPSRHMLKAMDECGREGYDQPIQAGIGWSLYAAAIEAAPQPAQQQCKKHPDAPHGFLRDASHTENRYVCECEYWEPPAPQPRQWQGLTAPEQTECYDLNPARFANNIEAKLREKNT